VEDRPEGLIGNRTYDSDPLDAQLEAEGMETNLPAPQGRQKA
jgi:hypothetical protein